MGLYSEVVFPRLYDFGMDRPAMREHRFEQLRGIEGEVLEIGIGTGLNLACYPDEVTRVVGVEPSPGMGKRLRRRVDEDRVAHPHREVELHRMSGESLPFDSGRFPHVVSTLTLCSIRELDRALAEVRRVLAPGGTFHFFEHGISDDASVRRWQHRLERFQRLWAVGCSLLTDVGAHLERADFASLEVERFLMDGAPKIHAPMWKGRAVR
ncbi:MAG: class I SAM-dependent methyltransferase [Planctomycetota bacterium]